MTHRSKTSAFSLIELLVTFVLLAMIIAFIVPRYIGLQRSANIQVAQQQVDAVKKAVLAWSAAEPSLTQLISDYGAGPKISLSAWNTIASNYIDPSFASRLTPSGSDPVAYFTTSDAMQNLAGSNVPASDASNVPAGVALTSPPKNSSGQYIAYGVIYWSPVSRTTQPTFFLFYPH